MKKLSFQIPAAKLREFTHLRTKCNNEMRWSSTYNMLTRYKAIREFLPALEVPEIEELVLSDSANHAVDSLCITLHDLDSVTKELQEDSLTLAQARAMFVSTVKEFPETEDRLKDTAVTIENPRFENAIVSIQNGRCGDLTLSDQRLVDKLKAERAVRSEPPAKSNLTFSQCALRRHNAGHNGNSGQYVDLKFIRPTSNLCERLFSKAGFALNSRRRAVLPANFESQIFLHVNADLWGLPEINEILQ